MWNMAKAYIERRLNEPLGAKGHRWWEKKSIRKTLAK
jgi:hypothetical protein